MVLGIVGFFLIFFLLWKQIKIRRDRAAIGEDNIDEAPTVPAGEMEMAAQNAPVAVAVVDDSAGRTMVLGLDLGTSEGAIAAEGRSLADELKLLRAAFDEGRIDDEGHEKEKKRLLLEFSTGARGVVTGRRAQAVESRIR